MGDIQPIRQGLDALCALYAVVNSMRLVQNGISYNACHEMFNTSLRIIEKRRGSLLETIREGMYCADFYHLLMMTCDHWDIKRYRPFYRKGNIQIDIFWKTIQWFLRMPNRSVIICYETSTKGHWSVVRSASDRTLYLFDSDGRKIIRRAQSTTAGFQPESRQCIHYPFHATFLCRKTEKPSLLPS